MKRRILAAAVTAVMAVAMYGSALATPHAPTNGGNGAGQSGQCTGPASARPTSCQSPGGVSGR